MSHTLPLLELSISRQPPLSLIFDHLSWENKISIAVPFPRSLSTVTFA